MASSTTNSRQRRVAYVHSRGLEEASSQLPSNVGRSRQVHDLVRALGLLNIGDSEGDEEEMAVENARAPLPQAKVIPPCKASRRDLSKVHDLDFVDFLLDPDGSADSEDESLSSASSTSALSSDQEDLGDSEGSTGFSSPPHRPIKRVRRDPPRAKRTPASRRLAKLARFGLLDDSPLFPSLGDYVKLVAGGSLAAAQAVLSPDFDVAISWDGGRHHAMRESASGFCYVNDCSLAVQFLASSAKIAVDGQAPRRPRVLYLDFDVHLGDGVAEAFLTPLNTFSTSSRAPNILTLSMHHSSPSFFPPSALSGLTPPTTNHPHTLSLPLAEGASSTSLARVWEGCVEKVVQAWRPDWVVVCCGVDGMAGDGEKTGVWNLGLGEERGELGWCVGQILQWETRGTVLLGGGGYHHANAARAWSSFTCIALGRPPLRPTSPIPDIGIADQDWDSYSPSFELGVPTGNMLDSNTEQYLQEACDTFTVLAERLRMP